MATLINKKKNGRYYTYWVRSGRVEGKPRIVEQVYLGPKDRVLEEIKLAFTRGSTPGPCPLKTLQVKEFGASALLWNSAGQLRLAEIVDRHVPVVLHSMLGENPFFRQVRNRCKQEKDAE